MGLLGTIIALAWGKPAHTWAMGETMTITGTTPLAEQMYQQTVEDTRGKKVSEVSNKVLEQGKAISAIANAMGAKAKEAVPEATDPQQSAQVTLTAMSQETQQIVEQTLVTPEGAQKLADTGAALQKEGKELKETTTIADVENKKHEGNTVGEANLAKQGSATVDLAKVKGEDRKGAVAHENKHQNDAEQDTHAVSVTSEPLAEPGQISDDMEQSVTDKSAVTRRELSEAAAMLEQNKAAPKSMASLAEHYKQAFQKVTSMGVSEAEIVRLSERPDGLRIFGEKVRAQRAGAPVAMPA